MSKPEEKTNVMRLLDAAGVPYQWFVFEATGEMTGVDMANIMGQDVNQVFKTLVTVGKTGEHYVFMVPVDQTLDLKKAARAVGEKSIAMIKSKELLPLTGYVHGGCSPIGMKKQLVTVIDETAVLFDTIFFSGGRIGAQVQLAPDLLGKLVPGLTFADIVV